MNITVSVRLQDLNVNPGDNCSATQPHTRNCIVWWKPDQKGVIYTTHEILICSHIFSATGIFPQ